MKCHNQAANPPLPRIVALIALCLSFLAPAATVAEGKSAAEIIGQAAYLELQAKGKAVRTGDGASLVILPDYPAAEAIRKAVAEQKPGLAVETVFALPRQRPTDPAKEKAELAAIYGLMRSFSTLKGIEYYSITRKAMRVLYAESYRIDDAVKRNPLPDEPFPAPDAIPASETLLVFQKDLSLGANVYRYSFTSFPDAVLAEATNLTKMSYSIFPAVAPEKFKTRILVIQADDAIVFYMVSAADCPSIVRSRLGESLANRAEALFRWFSAKSPEFLSRE